MATEQSQQQRYGEALHETALALMNRLDTKELLETIITRACEILKTPHGFIYILEPEEDAMVVKVGLGIYQSYQGVRRKKDEPSASSAVWRSGKPLSVVDYQHWAGRAHDRMINRYSIKSIICLPLTSDEKVIGLIGVGFEVQKESFSQAEEDVMERFAALASLALDNAKLYQALQNELEEKKRVAAALRDSEMNYRGIFDSVSDLIFVMDAQTGDLVDINQNVLELFDYQCEKKDCLPDIAAELTNTLLHVVQQLRADPKLKRYMLEWKLPGKTVWLEFSIRQAVIASRERILAVARDVSDRKKFEDQLEYQAYHDVLTGLPNRRMLERHLTELIAQTEKRALPNVLAVVFIDLDGFKQVNDWFGHDAGDNVLKQVALKMGNYIGESDLAARMGGDEFVVVLNEAGDRSILTTLLQQLKKACRCVVEVKGRTVTVTASMGVSLFPADGRSAAELIRRADKAMYRCKKTARGGYCLVSQ
ncbi:sensor domain-containing protein [Azotosporobacter soli]|uniref:sensor domain-containing protein n=1 Tax=Azotosporobacter soli TaxID=3055040 RepID=UPI0031FE96F6